MLLTHSFPKWHESLTNGRHPECNVDSAVLAQLGLTSVNISIFLAVSWKFKKMGARCLETVGLHQCKWHHNTVMWCDVMRYHVTHSEFDETDLREQLGCSPDHSPLAWQVRIMVPKRRYPSRQLYAAMAPRLVPGTTNTRPLSGGVSGPQFTAKLKGWVNTAGTFMDSFTGRDGLGTTLESLTLYCLK